MAGTCQEYDGQTCAVKTTLRFFREVIPLYVITLRVLMHASLDLVSKGLSSVGRHAVNCS